MIVATAGHVDHGKTTLVRALTGVDTDRLPEEKKRGLTIDLGFAYHEIEDDVILGFVDVPGHERFVKNMLAGVATIDFVLLVIAADDGVMPQTEEHLAILNLLGIRQGAVAITKIDRVATERIDYVIEEIEILLHGSHLADCPVFPVSGEVGTGMADLRSHLETTARTHGERAVEGHFRLSVDRAFNIQGAGLVVTGAVYSGQVTVGDHLILAAQGSEQPIDARVRGLRALDREAKIGRAGQRCAVNITGADINLSRVSRGDWLLAQAVHAPVQKFDARVKVLQSENRPLAHWTPVHVHLGAADITGRIAVLGERRIPPGHDELAQLVLDAPIGALFNDRFVLRDQSAQRTIAGGVVVDLYPPRRGRSRPDRLEMLLAMERAEARTALTAMLSATNNGVNLLHFAKTRNLTDADVRKLRGHENNICLPSEQGEIVLSQERWHTIEQTVLDALAHSHKKQPEAVGPNDNGLRISLQTPLPPTLLVPVIARMIEKRKIIRDGISLRLPGHNPRPSDSDLALWKDIATILEAGGIRPPRVREVAEELRLDPKHLEAFFKRCARQGRLMAVAPNRYFPPEAIGELAKIVEELCTTAGDEGFTAAAFKNQTGIGRNVAIEVLEFFDAAGLTRREGNARYLRRSAEEVFG